MSDKAATCATCGQTREHQSHSRIGWRGRRPPSWVHDFVAPSPGVPDFEGDRAVVTMCEPERMAERDAALARVKELEAALREHEPYLRHHDDCDYPTGEACVCGLLNIRRAAALAKGAP